MILLIFNVTNSKVNIKHIYYRPVNESSAINQIKIFNHVSMYIITHRSRYILQKKNHIVCSFRLWLSINYTNTLEEQYYRDIKISE